MGQNGLFLIYFSLFLISISITDLISTIQIEISVDGELVIRTQGHRMVGIDETKEQWQPPFNNSNSYNIFEKYQMFSWHIVT